MDVAAGIAEAVGALEPGGQLVGVFELTGGVSANVVGLEIATPTGGQRRVVFRQHRSSGVKHHDRTVTRTEHDVLAALHRHGLAVPEPYLCDDSGTSTAPYLVIEWVDGSTDPGPDALPAALDQMAEFLARLHLLDPSTIEVPGLAPIEDPVTVIGAYLPTSDAGRRVRAMLDAGDLSLHVDRQVLLHGDYWPGNVIWRDGRLVAVIDWEDARLGDPLADLATARVELLCRYDDEAMERFTSAYLSARHDTVAQFQLDSLALWEVYVSAAALATMGGWGLDPAEEDRRRRRTQRFFDRAAEQLR